MTQIIMSHLGRSGSTVIAQLLGAHSEICWLNEVFTLHEDRTSSRLSHNATELAHLIERYAAQQCQSPVKFVGYEIKLINFLHNPKCSLIDFVRAAESAQGCKVVILSRKNVLRRLMSSAKAASSRVYHSNQADRSYSDFQYSVSVDDFHDFDTGIKGDIASVMRRALAREAEIIDNYRRLGIETLHISYEEDVEPSPMIAYGKILEFVGLQAEPAATSLKKTSRPLKEEISNYAELSDALAGTEFADML
ncbi:MAG: hypothetical protein AAFV62_01650 [Pseudomonadota bacterium]